MRSILVWYSRIIDLLKKHGRVLQDLVFALPAKLVHRLGISPNFVSVLTVFTVFVSALLLYQNNRLYLLSLSIAICLDMLDGTLARTYVKTASGKFFDFFSDRFSDTMLLSGLAASGMLSYSFSLTLLFLYVLSTLLAKLLENKVRVYLLSYRILTFAGLLFQEFHPKALALFSGLLFADYLAVALFILPKIVFRKK